MGSTKTQGIAFKMIIEVEDMEMETKLQELNKSLQYKWTDD